MYLRMLHKEFSLMPCDDLSEWDGGGESKIQEGGDIYIDTYSRFGLPW